MGARAVAERIEEYVGGPGLSTADAQLMGALVTSIQRQNARLDTTEILRLVIAKSRPKSSPTHHLFEWDQAKGHALYLMDRARTLVRTIRFVPSETPDEPMQAFPILLTEGKRGPVAMHQVMQSKDMMTAVIEQAKADLVTWRRRYDHLRRVAKMSGVFAAIDGAVKG